MKMVKSLLLGLTVTGAMLLGGCDLTSNGGDNTTGGGGSTSVVQQVVDGVKAACGFVAPASAIVSIFNIEGAASVTSVISEICDKVNQVKVSRKSRVGAGGSLTVVVHGVPVSGHLVSSRRR
jgi:hypothetical protein